MKRNSVTVINYISFLGNYLCKAIKPNLKTVFYDIYAG